MDYLDIDRITRAGVPQWAANAARDGSGGIVVREGVGYTLRQLGERLHEVSVASEKRVELEVAAGDQALLYVLSGGGRLEGDDTAIGQDDVVWFKPALAGARQMIGIEADTPLRALLFAAGPSAGAAAPPL